MMEDEIVKEVHETRQRIFEECGRDIERYIERLKAGNAKYKNRLVTLQDVQQRAGESKVATRPGPD
jgi:hypothetical protein